MSQWESQWSLLCMVLRRGGVLLKGRRLKCPVRGRYDIHEQDTNKKRKEFLYYRPHPRCLCVRIDTYYWNSVRTERLSCTRNQSGCILDLV